MREVTITLPDVIEFESRGVAFGFDLSQVAEGKLAELLGIAAIAGIVKAGIDSGSSAKTFAEENGKTVEEATEILVGKWIKARYTGIWGRVAGLAESSDVTEAKALLRVQVRAGNAKAYKDSDSGKRAEMVNAAWDALSDNHREAYLKAGAAAAARKAEDAKRRAEAVAALPSLDIKL